MKFFIVFVTLVAFCKVATFSQDTKSNALRQSFVNISEVKAQRNHLMTIVTSAGSGDGDKSGLFASIAEIPHVVARFENNYK